MGVVDIVLKMGHLYNVIIIGFSKSLCSCYPSTVIYDFWHFINSILFFLVPIIHLGVCYYRVSPLNFMSVQPKISYWIQLWLIVISCSFLSNLFFWYLLFSIKSTFVAFRSWFSVDILLFYASCLMVLVFCVSTYFSGVVAMSRLSSA